MGADASPDEAEALLALAEECSLTLDQARERMRRIVAALEDWRKTAQEYGIPGNEIETMAESIETRLAALSAASRP